MIDKSIINVKKQLIWALSIFMIVLIGFYGVLEQKEYLEEVEKRYVNNNFDVSNSFDYEISNLDNFYNTRMESISSMKPIANAVESKDMKKLYNSSIKIFQRLKKENSQLKIMHYHSSDNTTILRMHNPKKYGDDLTLLRPIIKDSNQFLKKYTGLEMGKHGLYFRVVTPVFNYSKTKHTGVLEMGIDLDHITTKLKQYYPSNMFAYLLDKKRLGFDPKLLDEVDNNFLIDKNDFFKKVYKRIDFTKDYSIVNVEDKVYAITHNITLKNHQDENIGVMLNAIDITMVKEEHQQHMVNVLLFWTLLFLFLVFAINYGLSAYIKKFEMMTDELDNKFEELKKNKDILEKYTIYSETDLKGHITYVSDAFCEISGYTKDELIGKSHNIVRHEDMKKSVYEELWSLLTAGQYWEGEIKNKRKDGSYYWVKAYITPKFDQYGEIIGYSAVRKDITLQKQLNG